LIIHTQTDSRKKRSSRGQYRSSQTQNISEAQQHKRLKGNDLFSKHLAGGLHNNNILLATENII
jgi:hypothetical protein